MKRLREGTGDPRAADDSVARMLVCLDATGARRTTGSLDAPRRDPASESGDIIFTGTLEGVIQGKPADKRVWLKAGDKLASSLSKLSELRFELT